MPTVYVSVDEHGHWDTRLIDGAANHAARVTVEAEPTAYFNTWPWAFWSFPGEVEETEGDES